MMERETMGEEEAEHFFAQEGPGVAREKAT
jgi:hypothetical protein